jgi:hypothetical protein
MTDENYLSSTKVHLRIYVVRKFVQIYSQYQVYCPYQIIPIDHSDGP